MEYDWITSKSILSPRQKNGQYWFGIDYTVNLYRGCNHGCIYCDSRSQCYGIDDFSKVRPKKEALVLLERELKSKKQKGVISLGAMSDSYNALEKELQLTRGALALFAQYGFGLSLETKSDFLLRDSDLFQQIAQNNGLIIKFSFSTPSQEKAKKIEPQAASPAARFHALRQLSEKGIYCGVLYCPILPFLTDSVAEVQQMVAYAKEAGAKFIYPYWGITLRDRQRDFFYAQLDHHYPGLRTRYAQTYGSAYACGCPQVNNLQQVFQQACQKNGLFYRMADIINGYRQKIPAVEQISLFK